MRMSRDDDVERLVVDATERGGGVCGEFADVTVPGELSFEELAHVLIVFDDEDSRRHDCEI